LAAEAEILHSSITPGKLGDSATGRPGDRATGDGFALIIASAS
jgi:hypothetical protein